MCIWETDTKLTSEIVIAKSDLHLIYVAVYY